MQEDMQWSGEHVSDMCEPLLLSTRETLADLWYHDEITWESLPPELVAAGEQQELDRFKSTGVYSYVLREDAEKDADGVHVKTKWVRVNKGTAKPPQVNCRLVAQEAPLGERLDELFAGTPSMSGVRLLLRHSRQDGRCIMTMDVKTAFLYGVMRRKVSIELQSSLYGTRDAPQIWQQEVSDALTKLGFQCSVFQPCVFVHKIRNVAVVIHVDHFSCSGQRDDLLWMYDELSKKYEMNTTLISQTDDHETTYIISRLKLTQNGVRLEGDPKHVDVLVKEWGLDFAEGFGTPMTKESASSAGDGDQLGPWSHRTYQLHGTRSARLGFCSPSRISAHEFTNDWHCGGSPTNHSVHQDVSEMRTEHRELHRGCHIFGGQRRGRYPPERAAAVEFRWHMEPGWDSTVSCSRMWLSVVPKQS